MWSSKLIGPDPLKIPRVRGTKFMVQVAAANFNTCPLFPSAPSVYLVKGFQFPLVRSLSLLSCVCVMFSFCSPGLTAKTAPWFLIYSIKSGLFLCPPVFSLSAWVLGPSFKQQWQLLKCGAEIYIHILYISRYAEKELNLHLYEALHQRLCV